VYKDRGYAISSPTHTEDIDELHKFAEMIAKEYSPEPIFCIDIGVCRNQNELKLIEINSFSCSGLYKCDETIIVKEVSEHCWRESEIQIWRQN